MTDREGETIVALASAPGGAARAIVRLAGDQVAACLASCFRPAADRTLDDVTEPEVIPGEIDLDEVAAPLPCELYFWPDRRSYTRSPLAEIHTLGSPPLAEALLQTLCRCGARLAEPGEFTLRAFLAGRLDLTQAEAVLGVIDARADTQLEAALAQLAGGLSRPLDQLRTQLLELLAHLEAGLDFAEEDIEFVAREELLDALAAADRQIADLIEQMRSSGHVPASGRVALVGLPNVGKSSLFNALAAASHALVSAEAGTTRDYLTAEVEYDGGRYQLIDTAGVESTDEHAHVATAAQQARTAQQQAAEVVLLCLDGTRDLLPAEVELLAASERAWTIVVQTKADRMGESSREPRPAGANQGEPQLHADVFTSSHSGAGLEELRRAIAAKLSDAAPATEVVASTAARCRESLQRAADAVEAARQLVESGGGEELVAVELRAALDELGCVTGAVYTDDILDRIFSRFCIGK
ncbi:MAG: GTP-binding protein [Planctomycetota bacterium]|nr:MAG: GTP-binding protein [Planctomycetota bacterium]REJ89831.1 MAG: GTP-binding protein [Planctomycetota bacterium]